MQFYCFTGKRFCWFTPLTDDKKIKVYDIREKTMRVFDPRTYFELTMEQNCLLRPSEPAYLFKIGMRKRAKS